MAWHNAQQTKRLLEALLDVGKGQKGSGKNGGGTSKTPQKKKQWCRWKNCTAANAGTPTFGDKCECRVCGKHFSQEPPLEMLVDWAYNDTLKAAAKSNGGHSTKGTGKGQKGAQGKGNGKGKPSATAPPPPQRTTAEAAADAELRRKRLEELKAAKVGGNDRQLQQQADDSATGGGKQRAAPTPGTLDPDTLLELKQVQATIDSITTLIATDVVVVQPEKQDAEASLASHMLAFQPCATAEARATLEARITETKSLHAAATSADMQQMLSEKLEEQQEKLSRLCKRGAPSAAQEASSLREALQALDRRQKGRLDKEQTGQDKAKERIEKRTDLMTQLYNHISVLADAIQVHENEQLAGHAAKSQTLAQQEEDVAAILRQRIAAADAEVLAGKQKAAAATNQSAANANAPQAQQGAAPASTAAPQSQQPPPVDAALQKALLELETFKLEQKRLIQTIGDLQAAATIADATAAEAEAALAAPMDLGAAAPTTPTPHPRTPAEAHALRIRYVKDDLVTLDRVLSDKEKRVAGAIIANARTWIERALPPITYDQLLAGAAPAADAITLLEGMIGSEIWTKFYEGQPALTIQDFVPAQLASIIQAVALKLDKEVLEYSVTLKDKAAKTFDKAEAADMVHREKHTGAYRAY